MSDTPKGTVRRRAVARTSAGSGSSSSGGAHGGSTSTMMRIYTDDSPGLRVDPVVVLVLSLAFIASVFALHIYGKFTKG
ncbi:uncharacterized protein VTP21DRAFT_8781 [Calcarisporiella thermophila]|uniref:uncharacterized protein n=1 Tax=Calcarisporiella thermophila TaxID=911321 RepID=UPI003743D1AB